MQISDLVDDVFLPAWADYPDLAGFRVLLRLPDAAQGLMAVARAHTATGEEAPPETVFYLARYAVADWQGLTVAGLRRLTNVRVKGRAEQEIPCNAENVEALLRLSAPFLAWVLGRVRERQEAAAREAAETENLSATPNTTPIPTP